MAIAGFNPIAEVVPKPVLPEAQPKNYMGLTYDNNQTPVSSLLSYVDGAPWTLHSFFRQVLGQHNDLKEIDPNLSPEFQSYNKIRNLEIRIQSDLSSTTNGDTQFTEVSGSALVYGFVIPNVNDYFIVETSHLRPALFRVTAVDRLTWRRESVHGIQYSMVDYVDSVQSLVNDLNRKTTSEYVFSRDRLMEGLSPILKTNDYKTIDDLNSERNRIGHYYLDAFSLTSTRTLNMPGQPGKRIYDSFLVDFILSTWGYIEFPEVIRIKQLPKSGDLYLEQPQFWDAIINRDRNRIEYGNKIMKVARTEAFPATTYIKSMWAARMDFIVYPYKPDTSAQSGGDLEPLPFATPVIKDTTNANGERPSGDQVYVEVDGRFIPGYHKVDTAGYYVLSRAFYENDSAKMSLLEILTRDYLNESTIDLRHLTALINMYPKMERMEQFYYGPLLMCLIRYADQRTHSN